MGVLGNQAQFRSFLRWRNKSRRAIAISKTCPEPLQDDQDVTSIDSEPYSPKNLDFKVPRNTVARDACDDDSSDQGSKLDESTSSTVMSRHGQEGRAVDNCQSGFASVGYLTAQTLLSVPEEDEGTGKSPLIHSNSNSPDTDRSFQGTGDHMSPATTAVTENSGPSSTSSGYSAGKSGSISRSISVEDLSSSSNSKSSRSVSELGSLNRGQGSETSSKSNSGGDLGSRSNSTGKLAPSDSQLEVTNKEELPLTETGSSIHTSGPVYERSGSEDRRAKAYGKEEGQTAEHKGGGDESSWTTQSKLRINKGERLINHDQAVESESGNDNRGWYIHWSKSSQCITNHYQLRPVMDELRSWSMKVPGTVNIRYTHTTGVEVCLPWPDLRTGSREQIQHFVEIVNSFAGRQVFYYLFIEHPKGFIRSMPPRAPSPTSACSSGSNGVASLRKWIQPSASKPKSENRLEIQSDISLTLSSPILTSIPFASTYATRLVWRASGSKMLSGLDSNLYALEHPSRMPQGSRGVQKYIVYHA
ncbi:hypothetical protein R1flu_000432 [Riccia fluitans]|uniref:Uncharacterized protein n=1 Tax=Riccia fluitans TaxID=41844 RepID=A0ABD1Y3E2_9MARC